ncbi:hypothetical protein LguiA_016996 [Lonicera macranthoides]
MLKINDLVVKPVVGQVQEDIKASLAEGLKTNSDQVGTNAYRESLQEISSLFSTLPERVETQGVFYCTTSPWKMPKISYVPSFVTVACSLKVPAQKNPTPSVLPPKAINYRAPAQEMPPRKSETNKFLSDSSPVLRPKVRQATMAPKIEMGTWNSVKRERVTFTDRDSNKGQKQTVVSPIELQRQWRVIIESDKDIDGGFSCLLKEKQIGAQGRNAFTMSNIYVPMAGPEGNYSIEEAKDETERILRKARRRKRKHSNTIVIN